MKNTAKYKICLALFRVWPYLDIIVNTVSPARVNISPIIVIIKSFCPKSVFISSVSLSTGNKSPIPDVKNIIANDQCRLR